mgnify:CR=1 FL=1
MANEGNAQGPSDPEAMRDTPDATVIAPRRAFHPILRRQALLHGADTMVPLDEAHPRTLQACPACAVIDIQAELRFWEQHYAQQAFHRNGVAFRHYVPTLKFAYDTYLLSPHDALEDLMPSLATRYERNVVSGMRLDWPVAQEILRAVWRRLGAPLQNAGRSSIPRIEDALDEPSIVAAALQQNDTGSRPTTFTQSLQR